jgi:two-component system alkaline phosphatase synthesis response regulator PhoP
MYGKTVLIADDEENIRRLVRTMLGKDYLVLEAADGETAVNIARKQRPDLVLLDIMMPKMDGYAALHKIKSDQATKKIPVVMVSGLGYELNRKLAKQLGADGYINKPFNLRELQGIVGRLVPVS